MIFEVSVMCFGSGAKGVVPDETRASSSNQESHDVGMYTARFPMLELLPWSNVFLHT